MCIIFFFYFASKKIVSPMFAVVFVCARVCVSACMHAFMSVSNFIKQEHHWGPTYALLMSHLHLIFYVI